MVSTSSATLPGSRRAATVLALVLAAVIAAVAGAEAASLSLSWNAPGTNADGTPLRDLAGYRIYLGTSPPACPGATFHAVSSPTTRPASGQTVSTSVSALSAGTTYYVRLTAVDTSGNESACSGAATGVAQPTLAVTPSGSSSFGSVTIGGTADRTFTVQNTSGASTSVAVSAGAPFSVTSAASFSLGAGASRAVTVRFRPTAAGAFAGNARFTAGGETVSRGVSGSATAAASVKLSIKKNGPGAGTVTSAAAGISCARSCTQMLVGGTSVTLTASPGAGSAFAGWSGACSGTGSCAMTVNAATSVTATFAKAPPVPVARTLSPAKVTAGGVGLTLTVNGSGFAASSVVRWGGAARTTTFVNAKRLRVAISASDLAAPRSMPVSVVTPSPGGGTSAALTFTITPAPPPPPTPGAVSVAQPKATAAAALVTVTWARVSGAKSYRYVVVFDDGSATVEGTVKGRSFRLRMPYHASGAAAGARVCIRSLDATGQQSAGQSCSAVAVPARPPAKARRPATPPPPPPPPGDQHGWGVG